MKNMFKPVVVLGLIGLGFVIWGFILRVFFTFFLLFLLCRPWDLAVVIYLF
jgi:hypothetical protein